VHWGKHFFVLKISPSAFNQAGIPVKAVARTPDFGDGKAKNDNKMTK
jgi:hypothetical protein